MEGEGFAEDFGGVFAAIELGVEAEEGAEGGEARGGIGGGELGFEGVEGLFEAGVGSGSGGWGLGDVSARCL